MLSKVNLVPRCHNQLRFASSVARQSLDQNFASEEKHGPAASFQHARIGDFFQEKPLMHNPYLSNSILKSFLKRYIPKQYFQEVNEDLVAFGERICNEIDAKGEECELRQPSLKQYDAWGRRVDQLDTCEAWNYMKKVVAEEGLVAHGYDRAYGEASRIYQFAKQYLFAPSSGLYSCPTAMTDGAAKVLEPYFNASGSESGIFKDAFRRLTSTDPDDFWTSGQWMTERGGGSDVANGTETVAIPQADGSFQLHGYKWFTSASDADMTLTLARIADENGEVASGSRGLSLFFLETRGEAGNRLPSGLNGLQIQRLKDKLGTRQLPTAEMLLDGTVAYQVGQASRGVREISGMLTVTRIYNSLWSCSGMHYMLQRAVDYSRRRSVFGAKLSDNSLHMQTLARMDVEARSGFLLTFEIIRLLGLIEVGAASRRDLNVMRILTPVCKLYTAKQAMAVISEGLESFGGMGYLEDTGLPKQLRDAQVLPIWEGTTNVLSLDVLRAIEKSGGEVMADLFESVRFKLDAAEKSQKTDLAASVKRVRAASESLEKLMQAIVTGQRKDLFMLAARDISYSIARVYMGALMVEHAAWQGADKSDIYAAKRWCEQELCPVVKNFESECYEEIARRQDKELVFAGSK